MAQNLTFAPVVLSRLVATVAGVIALIAISTWLLHNLGIARTALAIISLGILVIFIKETLALKGTARRRMIVALILMLEAIVFFVLYSQMPTSLNFFALHNVEHEVFAFLLNPHNTKL